MATDEGAGRRWAWLIIAVGVLLVTTAAGGLDPDDARTLAHAGARTALGLLALAVGIGLLAGRPLAEALRARPARPPVSVREWASLCAGLLALSALLDAALHGLGLRDGSRLARIEEMLAGVEGGDWLIVLGGVALAPAIAEELLFRGALLDALLRRGPAWLAVAISAAVFGAAHLDLAQGGATAILGLYLGAVSVATGTVRVGIAAHFLNNAVALLVPTLGPDMVEHPAVATAVALGLALGGGAAAVVLGRRLRRRPSPTRPDDG